MGGRYRMSDEYTQAANQIIDEISEYFYDEYDLKPKPRLAKTLKEAKEDGVEPSLIYGEDYYALEDDISNKIKNLVMRKANRLVHKRVAKWRKEK